MLQSFFGTASPLRGEGNVSSRGVFVADVAVCPPAKPAKVQISFRTLVGSFNFGQFRCKWMQVGGIHDLLSRSTQMLSPIFRSGTAATVLSQNVDALIV